MIGIIIACLIIGFYFSGLLINFITSLIPSDVSVVSLNPSDGMLVVFWSGISITLLLFSFIGGFLLWKFSEDILFPRERSVILKNIIPSTILFVIGFCFGLYLYLLIMIPYFLEINNSLGLNSIWSLNTILTSSLIIACSIGLSFQLPIILRNLIKFGLIKKELLQKNRGIVIIGLLLISAIITPPDMISQIMVGLPLYLLFELSLINLFEKKVDQKILFAEKV